MKSPCVRVYSRPGCHLCEDLIEALLPLVRGQAVVEVRNVDTREDWRSEYGSRIPVVEVDDHFVCQHYLDAQAVCEALRVGKASMAAS